MKIYITLSVTDMVEMITSKQNNLVKYIRSLKDKKTRNQEGLFVVEGAKSVYEAVSFGGVLKKLVVSERGQANPLLREITAGIINNQAVRVTDQVMEFMSDTESPQGVMGIFEIPRLRLQDLITDNSPVLVIIDGVQDPGNVGTIIRSADAFGAGAVILTKGSADIYSSKTVRSTMGSLFHIPVIQDVSDGDLIDFLTDRSFQIAVTSVEQKSALLPEVEFRRPLALVFGSEGRGVSPEILQAADVLIKVPMSGSAESLNVAVTSGIVLYDALRRCGSNGNQTCK